MKTLLLFLFERQNLFLLLRHKKQFTSPHELQQKLNSLKKKNSPRRVLIAPTSVLPFLRLKKGEKRERKKAEAAAAALTVAAPQSLFNGASDSRSEGR